MLVFEEKGKTGLPRENPLTRLTLGIEPDHIGGKRVLSPLCHPCSLANNDDDDDDIIK